MLFELVLALLVGVACGVLTGLTPGIHINLVAVVLLGFSAFFLTHFSPVILVVFIVSMAITHTFLDFIPSIFLGAPDEDTVLSILPGHEFLIRGKAYEAVILTLYGSIFAIFIIILLTTPAIVFLPIIYPYVLGIMPIILILASGFLIYFEKNSRWWAIIIFLLAGILGTASLNLPLKEPLLPMLTGLFGASSLITSLIKKQKIPEQKISRLRDIKIKKSSFIKAIMASVISSPFCCLLPGLGSGQAAVIGSEVFGDLNRKEFLVLLGAINTIVAGFSFIVFYSVQKTRTGAAVAVSKLLADFSSSTLLIILGVILCSGIISFFLGISLAKIFSKNISKLNYKKLSLSILIFLAFIIFLFSGWLGLLVFLVSTCLGLTTIFLGIKRIHLMGCLLLPVILYYLF